MTVSIDNLMVSQSGANLTIVEGELNATACRVSGNALYPMPVTVAGSSRQLQISATDTWQNVLIAQYRDGVQVGTLTIIALHFTTRKV